MSLSKFRNIFPELSFRRSILQCREKLTPLWSHLVKLNTSICQQHSKKKTQKKTVLKKCSSKGRILTGDFYVPTKHLKLPDVMRNVEDFI